MEDTERTALGATSFLPSTWECIACTGHRILPKKRNLRQWDEGSKLIILSDHNFAPVLACKGAKCPAIIRVEDGSLKELGDAFSCLLGDFTLPEGSIIAIGSLSHLQKAGLTAYTDKLVIEFKRFSSMFRNQVYVVPYLPMPLCGTDDPNLVKLIMDLSMWMDSTRWGWTSRPSSTGPTSSWKAATSLRRPSL